MLYRVLLAAAGMAAMAYGSDPGVGPYSQASVEASWPLMRPAQYAGISEGDYRALAKTFNPVQFDARAWVRLAKEAGQRYMVFTSKHHDGFCMFDSAYTDYKITKSPYGKDIVAMLAEAAREEKLPLGFYYSPPDMNHPGFRDTSKPSSANWTGEPWRAQWPLYIDYMEMQVRELLSRYGDVAVVWFDGLGEQRKYDGWRLHRTIREMQPDTLINNRIGLAGDYDTPEQRIPKGIPTKGAVVGNTDGSKDKGVAATAPRPEEFRPWETCMTINGTWAYNKNDKRYKSTTQLVQMLVDVASKGGNFLLNVGPTPEGTIQPEFVERLRGIGAWLKLNGDSIYGTTYGPWQNLTFGRSTAKGKRVYLHVFEWPAGLLAVPGAAEKIASARMLAGGRPVRFSQKPEGLTLDLAGHSAGEHATVIELRLK
ncbi:MAG: alpha-L-fucosidase [Acidobacteria bacterium]|nr:alpha-L-fucosidase [Acidobacteriota bacterium]